MKNTSKVGNLTVAKLLVALAEKGKTVLTPFGEGERYDLMIDEGEKVLRVQCKTGKLTKGCIVFNNYSQTAAGTKKYGTSVDAYGVHCPQNGKMYLVPASDCLGYKTRLRVEPTKNGRKKNIRYAEGYEI
jgi:PD-(D/E)XK endonuclease